MSPRRLGATVIAAVAAGALVSAQSKINSELSERVGGAFEAAWISFFVGLLLVGLIAVTIQPVRRALVDIPRIVRSGKLSWWQLIGGIGGAWLVTTQGIVVPLVGVTLFMVSVVAGQVVGSLLVDRIGLSPAGSLPVSAARAVAALLASIAVLAAAWPRLSGDGEVSWVLIAAIVAGAGTSAQQAINSQVAVRTGQPFAATTVNFIIGVVALTIVLGIQATLAGPLQGGLPSEIWLYLGGPIGVIFIALAAWAVGPLGVLAFGLLAIAGQLIGAVAIDFVFPTGPGPSWLTLVGLSLVGVAVLLAARSRRG